MADYDLIIIGGGVSGLDIAAQFMARNRGARVVILEREFTLGGRMRRMNPPPTPDALRRVPPWIMPSEGSSVVEKLLTSLGVGWETTAAPNGETLLGPEETIVPAYRNQFHTYSHNGLFSMVTLLEEVVRQDGVEIVCGAEALEVSYEGGRVHVRTNNETLSAYKVVCTLPPREVVTRIAFNPPLEAQRVQALESIATWKHNPAMVEFTYQRKFWEDYHLDGPTREGPCFQFYTGYSEEGFPQIVGYAHIPPQIGDNLTRWASEQLANMFRGEYGEERIFGFSKVSVRRWPKSNHIALYEKGDNDIKPARQIASAPAYHGGLFFTGSEYAFNSPGFLEGCFEATHLTIRRMLCDSSAGDEWSDYSGSEFQRSNRSGRSYSYGSGANRGRARCNMGYIHKNGYNVKYQAETMEKEFLDKLQVSNRSDHESREFYGEQTGLKTKSIPGTIDDIISNGNGSVRS